MDLQKALIGILIGILLFCVCNKIFNIEGAENQCPDEDSTCSNELKGIDMANCWDYDANNWACGVPEKKCQNPAPFIWCGEGDTPGPPPPAPGPAPRPPPPAPGPPSPDNDENFIKGICYTMPVIHHAPDNVKTDVASDKMWNDTRRKDLDILKSAGVTHLRVYDWDINESHENFLTDLEEKELKLMLSISNYFVYTARVGSSELDVMLNEITNNNNYRSCIHSISIGNEPDLNGDEGHYSNSMNTLKALLDSEINNNIKNKNDIKLTIPISFGVFGGQGPAVKQTNDIITKINVSMPEIKNRFVPSIQTVNTSTDIKNLFYDKLIQPAKEHIDKIGFYITEWSITPNGESNLNLSDTQNLLDMKSIINLKGIFGFQYMTPVDKSGIERSFGFTRFPQCGGGGAYPKDPNDCPLQNEVVCDYMGSMNNLSVAYGGNLKGLTPC